MFLPAGGTPRDRLAFYESQLVKYSPLGGVAQTASQVLTLPGEREERSRIVRKVLVSKLAAACGGLLWSPVLAVLGDFSLPIRTLLIILGGTSLAVHPVVLRRLCTMAGRVRPSFDFSAEIPNGALIFRSVTIAAAGVGSAGAGFAVLAGTDQGGVVEFVAAIAGFALAWSLAFLAVPLPGGIGLREFLLGIAIGAASGTILVAALGVRIVQMVAEVVLILHGRWSVGRNAVRGSSAVTAESGSTQ